MLYNWKMREKEKPGSCTLSTHIQTTYIKYSNTTINCIPPTVMQISSCQTLDGNVHLQLNSWCISEATWEIRPGSRCNKCNSMICGMVKSNWEAELKGLKRISGGSIFSLYASTGLFMNLNTNCAHGSWTNEEEMIHYQQRYVYVSRTNRFRKFSFKIALE